MDPQMFMAMLQQLLQGRPGATPEGQLPPSMPEPMPVEPSPVQTNAGIPMQAILNMLQSLDQPAATPENVRPMATPEIGISPLEMAIKNAAAGRGGQMQRGY